MLVLMNGYNQIGGSNTFLMVFSCCAGNGCDAGACGGAGVLAGALAGEGAVG